MKSVLPIVICSLVSCSQPTGPASLQLVPASYYSVYPGPRTSGGGGHWQNVQAKPKPAPPPLADPLPILQSPSNAEVQKAIDNLTRDASVEAERLNRRKRP